MTASCAACLRAGLTSDPPDPFVAVAAGRSALRVDDLLALAGLIAACQDAGAGRA